MAILHGSWLHQEGCLFVWGETWRRVAPVSNQALADVPIHPLAMTQIELIEWLRGQNMLIGKSLQQFNNADISTESRRKGRSVLDTQRESPSFHVIALPTYVPASSELETASMYPIHSATPVETESTVLQPWQVEGLCLDPLEATRLLNSLPLGTFSSEDNSLGGDIRFWSQVARWSLDLLSRCKFLPTLHQQPHSATTAGWRSLLDSAVDQTRLERFARLMPEACRTYQCGVRSAESKGSPPIFPSPHCPPTPEGTPHLPISPSPHLAVQLPPPPQVLLLEFLNSTIDAQVRAVVGTRTLPPGQSSVIRWLQALGVAPTADAKDIKVSNGNTLKAEPAEVERLSATLNAWTAPLQHQLVAQNLFRTCFRLAAPAPGEAEWTLTYCLQAADDPEFLINAETIWRHPVQLLVTQGRSIEQPQETLLRGLGLASRLYSPILSSLEQPLPQSCRLTPPQAYEFLKTVAWRFEDSGLGVVLPPSLANREGWANRLGLKISAQALQKQGKLGLQSLLNFQWKLAIGGQTLSKAEFDRLVALNSPLVEINGEWVELRPQDIKTAQMFFTSRKDQMALSLEDALRLGNGDTQTIEKLPVVSFEASGTLQELMATLTDNQAIAPIPTPANFQGQLRPYQARGASWLSFLERWGLGACLADDMGLGKTVQFIAFMLHLKEQQAIEKPTLLVCPTSVLGNWEREVKKFGPTLQVLVHHGDKRSKGKAFAKAVQGHDLIVTSYALIHRDVKDLQSVSWQGVVLDEAQNVKNPEAKQSQAVRQLQASFRFALTGTPVENRLSELWSILDFLNPGYLGPRQFFQRRFAMPIERYGDTASLQTLRSLVQPFILRRLKTDRDIIQDLPEKQEINEFCGLSAEQAALYQQVVDNSLAEIESAEGLQRRGMILALLVKLKQVCNHPVLYKGQRAEGRGQRAEGRGQRELEFSTQNSELRTQSSGKLQRLEEMLEEVLAEGDRALIFTQFAEWGKLLKPYLEQQIRREVLFLYGGSSKKQREEMIDRFQHDPQGPPIMILSLKAGGVGLNLTRANHVFHYDRWWNPAVENQATDRVFRIGQTRNVQVHKFVCTGTLEEKIHDMIESKRALAEQVVGAGEQWLTELDTDQLRNLLLLDRNAVIDDD